MRAARARRRASGRAVAAGLVALAALAVVARRAAPGGPEAADWPVGAPRAIAVRQGQARFVAPAGAASARTLVIVSSLARAPGRYPIRLRARSAARPEPPPLADDGPGRPVSAAPTIRPRLPAGANSPPPSERVFHLPVRDGDPSSPSNYVAIHARLRAHSPTVQVYVDPADLERVEDATVRDVVETFDRHVLPVARERIGLAEDVDRDGRFAVLLSGWLGHLADGRLDVDGFVRGADYEPGQAPPLGNRTDVMYLNAAVPSGPHLRTVMAHEYTHAVTYCVKAFGPARRDEEGWLDEALAHLAEDLHGFSRSNLDYRIAAFLDAPERYRLLVQDFGAADMIRSHGHRGASYLFLRWCADRYGPDLLGRLVQSDLTGVESLEAATGRPFASLYRGWTLSLFLDAIAPDAPPDRVPPRASRLLPDGPPEEVVLDGTTSHYAIVEGAVTPGVEVEVTGPAEARLQVTAVPLPRDYPRLDLSAGVEADPEGRPGLVVRLRERDGRTVRLEALRRVGPDGAKGQDLEGDALRPAFGRDRLEGRDRLVSGPLARDAGGTVLVIGRDARGRKVVARSE